MAATYTNFCCRSGGSNLNAGTLTGNTTEPGTSASFTYASGNWDGTSVFTVASGNPQSDGVAVGDFVSVYADGSTVTGYVGRVTAVSTTTITVSTTAKSGTAPTSGTGNRTLKVGGAWAGPSGTSGFPMNFVTNTLTNSGGSLPRINYKNDATYSITANINNLNADITHQGYTSSYGDYGKAILDGGTSGVSYNLIGSTIGAASSLIDFECRNNGASGSATGIFWNSNNGTVLRCVFHDFRGHGVQSNANTTFIQCEAYACNQANASTGAGFGVAAACTFIWCISHDNVGSNGLGFYTSSASRFLFCISESNGIYGYRIEGSGCTMYGCDAYNNTNDGIRINLAANHYITICNCNFIKNGGYGINSSGAGKTLGLLLNCGFGAGTQANTSGQTNGLTNIEDIGSFTYPADTTPYVAPTTGNFTLNSMLAIAGGFAQFMQTQSAYTGTVSYAHVGAAQPRNQRAGGRFGGF